MKKKCYQKVSCMMFSNWETSYHTSQFLHSDDHQLKVPLHIGNASVTEVGNTKRLACFPLLLPVAIEVQTKLAPHPRIVSCVCARPGGNRQFPQRRWGWTPGKSNTRRQQYQSSHLVILIRSEFGSFRLLDFLENASRDATSQSLWFTGMVWHLYRSCKSPKVIQF